MKALFFVGMLMTFGAAGGIENSVTTVELLQSIGVALAGLGLTAVGVSAIKEQE